MTAAHGSASLVPRLEAAAEQQTAVTFVDTDEPEVVEWGRLHEDARAMAARLQGRGLGPGGRVALLGPTSRSLITAIQATWLVGGTVMVLPLRTRLVSEEEHAVQTRERVALADVTLSIASSELAPLLEPVPGDPPVLTFSEVESGASASAYERPPEDPEAIAVLQFTSGSTADPKGVMIPQRCVTDNHDAMVERAPIDPDDVIVSWAPLYHDMGLVMLMTYAMISGAGLVIASPTRFTASPGRWMEWMSAFGGTQTIAPNFAFAVGARMLGHTGGLDLSPCRRLGNGSEPIDPSAMDAFAEAAVGHGLDPASLYGAYGMAEATVLISMPRPGTGFAVDVVDGSVLEHERHAHPVASGHPHARRLARVGPPIRGMEVRISDPETESIVADRGLGEIEVRGPSVVPGYFRRPDATESTFRENGWLRTGDLGYLTDGELVICGRLKDLIVVGGRNVFPQDLERAAETVDGVRKGNVIAFGVEGARGREAVVVAAEVKTEELARVCDQVARSVREAAGLRPADVILVRPGTLPKTSSGKLRRSLCRARYLAAQLEAL